VQGHSDERARLDTRPRLKGQAPQEMGETRSSPTSKGGPMVKVSEKRGSTRWRPGAAKQMKAAVCVATRSGSSLTDGSGSAKGEDGVLPQTANPASFSSSSTPPKSATADWGRGNPNWLGFEPPGRGGAYIGGGRWDGRRHQLPDAWRPSAAADMAARPPLSMTAASGES
jgi:hypothetical protein